MDTDSYKDKVGEVFGRWTIISFSRIHKSPSGYKVPYWNCECDCGTVREVNFNNLRKGLSRSCGCLNLEMISKDKPHLRKDTRELCFTFLLATYRSGARRRGISWELTEESFRQITSQDCHYCGVKPLQATGRLPFIHKGEERDLSDYLHNGIDRKDSSLGYSEHNCVPCCTTCNLAKRSMDYEDFISWMDRLVEFRLAKVGS